MPGTPRVIRNKLLVEPLYAGEKLGSGIIIPDMAQEERPVLGDVIAAGPDAPYYIGDRLVLRPSIPTVGYPLHSLHGSPIVIEPSDIVGQMYGKEFLPKPEDVVIVPDWRQKYKQVSSLIYLPPSALEQNQPVTFGIVTRVGKDCKDLYIGDYVVYPGNIGFEIGLIDTVYYILPEREVLATIHAN
jgi:co-chaperonin GroES (HSP10)